MNKRVVITGTGIICPMAHDTESLWQGILDGANGMAKTTLFDASTFPSKFSAEVKGYDLAKFTKNPDLHKYARRGSAFVIGAAAQACEQAGIEIETEDPTDGIDRRRMGVYLGAGEGSVDNKNFFNALAQAWNEEKEEMDCSKWADVAFKDFNAPVEMEQEPNMPAGHVALMTGARGESRSCLTACAASTQAIGEAMMLIRHGRSDIMIAGGAHSMIHPLGVTGFNRLTALSTRNDSPQTASRPFSATRDGFVLGEGGQLLSLNHLSQQKNEV